MADIETVLALAAVIRRVDGSNSLGAAALAEAIIEEWFERHGGFLLTGADVAELVAGAEATALEGA